MKKTLIFAGLMVFVTMGGALAFVDSSATYSNFNTINYDSSHPYASKKDEQGNIKIKVATTNYVGSAVNSVSSQVTDLSTLATSDEVVVDGGTAASNNGGLKAELAAMGGSTCGTSGGACNSEDGGNGAKLNVANTVNPSTGVTDSSNSYSTRCTGAAGGYSIAACGYIKNGNNRQWIQIVGGVASGS